MIVAQREANVKPTRSLREAFEKHTVMILVKLDNVKFDNVKIANLKIDNVKIDNVKIL